MMIRLLLPTALITILVLPAQAADLDRYHRHHRPRILYAPPIVYEERLPERIYTRPVVGFYGYPYDVGVPRPRPDYRATRPIPEPYMLDRVPPHVVDIE